MYGGDYEDTTNGIGGIKIIKATICIMAILAAVALSGCTEKQDADLGQPIKPEAEEANHENSIFRFQNNW